ncbi:hypothetical protein FQN57_006651 [Myotisia sp. PD_48]|nr:hypothetical protein FQN57_006651 [Myotisia sp. PD_48]
MARGNGEACKVFFRGETEDFILYVDSAESVQNWKKDSSVPLAHVVSGWKVFVNRRGGATGIHDTASKQELENEFGSSNEDVVVPKILKEGEIQASAMPERNGSTNDSKGIYLTR